MKILQTALIAIVTLGLFASVAHRPNPDLERRVAQLEGATEQLMDFHLKQKRRINALEAVARDYCRSWARDRWEEVTPAVKERIREEEREEAEAKARRMFFDQCWFPVEHYS